MFAMDEALLMDVLIWIFGFVAGGFAMAIATDLWLSELVRHRKGR